jgi:magnesium transporter
MSNCRALARLLDGHVAEVDPEAIDGLLRDQTAPIWLDIEDPDDADIRLLREEFGFHELALEDAALRGQRPKVDEYPDQGYYFIVLYAASCGPEVVVRAHEIHCFWGKSYLVTLHDGPLPEIATAIQQWSSARGLEAQTVAHQVYALLDAVVDGYFPVLDDISDRISDIETEIFDGRRESLRELFELRRELLKARRVLGPTRDVVNVLIRRDIPVFPPTLVPYLADVYDHSIRAIDTLDLQRELLSTAVETQLTFASNRLNQTMRTMTALAIALMAPTLIAGIYGMNFILTPPGDWELSFPLAVIVMVAVGGGILMAFKRVDWL